MSNKLDPKLRELVEMIDAGDVEPGPVEVIVGLDRPMEPADEAELRRRGLRVRSDIGDVLTGIILSDRIRELAEAPHVLKVEASTQLFRETGGEFPAG
jgi:hypothetical protein